MWLVQHIAEWAELRIEPKGKYLGFWMGPSVTAAENFTAPLSKFKSRVGEIVRSLMAPEAACRQFNTRAVTVTAYVAQIAEMPKSLLHLEAWAGTKICRFPGGTLTAAASANWNKVGCAKLISLTASCIGSMTRTALGGKIQWEAHLAMLYAQADDKLPVRRANQRQPWPAFWNTEAAVALLGKAAAGTTSVPSCMAHATLGAALAGRRYLRQQPPSGRNGLQAAVTAAFTDTAYEFKVGALTQTRWSKICGWQVSVNQEELLKSVLVLHRSCRLDAMRTFLNGWTTSARMHIPTQLLNFPFCRETTFATSSPSAAPLPPPWI